MTDEVKKIREEVIKIVNSINLFTPDEDGKNSSYEAGKLDISSAILQVIDSLQEEPVSENLGDYINELSKQFPEVSFAKLSRIAVRVAQWQKEQFEKNRLKHCDSITNEQAELEQGFIDQHLDKYQRMPTFLDAIEYGMKLQKEQIIKRLCNHANIDQMVEKFEDKYKPEKVFDTEYYKRGIFDTIKTIKED